MRDYPDYFDEDVEVDEPDLSQSYQDYKDGVSDWYPGLTLIKQHLSLFDWAGLTEDGYENLSKRYG